MSSNQSTGQWIGTIVGAVSAYFSGGLYGWQMMVGSAIGGLIDPPKGITSSGPRLSDLSQQTSTYGAAIPRIYGTVATMGNVFWIEGDKLKETVKKKKSGGKGGGGGSSVKTYTYSATFAVGLCKGPIAGVRRIWVGSKLIYDAGATDIESIIASNAAASSFRVYTGGEDQQPDPRMQSDKGVANTPAYRGLAYIVLYDYPLADHGNSLMGAAVKVEVVKSLGDTYQTAVTSTPYTKPYSNPAFEAKPYYVDTEKVVFYSPQWSTHYPATSQFERIEVFFNGVTTRSFADVPGTAVPPSGVMSSDLECPYPVSTIFTGGSFYGGNGVIQERDGIYAGISRFSPSFAYEIYIFSRAGGVEYSAPAPSGAHTVATDGEYVYVISGTATTQLNSDLSFVASGAGASGEIGLSRAYVDATGIYVLYGSGVTKIARDLSSVAAFAAGLSVPPSYYSTEFCVDGDVITMAGATPEDLVVRRYYLKNVTPNAVPLGDIVTAEAALVGVEPADIDVSLLSDIVRGYRISKVAAVRSAIDPLQAAWPFDIIQSGYQIKAVPRGGPSVMSISFALLDARASGSASGAALTIAREMDSQLPDRVSIQYLDYLREYDAGEQYAERAESQSLNVTELELAIVLTDEEAAGKAETLLYLYWLERSTISFVLPMEFGALEPADVITIAAPSAEYALRLVSVSYLSDGRVECTARYNSASIYTPAATGEGGLVTGGGVLFDGPSRYELLDIPALAADMDAPLFVAAMVGYTTGWPGGILYRTADGGQTWADLQGWSGKCTMGYARTPIAAPTSVLVDSASVITVDMLAGELESVSELSMLNGANHFAYGIDGRWEIIAARTCTLVSTGVYAISDMLRGRFGTEHNTGNHAVGDALVLLTDTDLALIGMDSAAIGMSRTYRGITAGRSIDSDTDREFVYRGVNLKPISPVYLNGNRHPSTSDWSLSWIRRTRIGGEWRDSVDATLSESTEAYEIDIYADGSYGTVKRTITSATPAVAYTSAQQVADFGSNQATLYLRVYQISATVGRGYALQTSITR